MARPPIELDEALILKLAAIHCTMDEIALICGCCKDTIERREGLLDKINTARAKGKSSLRRHQWSLAEKGNATMLIWLGKQLLDQKDVSKIELDKVPDAVFLAEAQRRPWLVPSPDDSKVVQPADLTERISQLNAGKKASE